MNSDTGKRFMKKSTQSECAGIMKALADATRLAVLQALLERPHHVNDLMERVGVQQSLLSHHLKVLREAGLVTSARDGKAVLYRVAPAIAGAKDNQCIDLKCCQVVFRPPSKRAL
jgi:DNA-binding transcriptional ArsR family regulator